MHILPNCISFYSNCYRFFYSILIHFIIKKQDGDWEEALRNLDTLLSSKFQPLIDGNGYDGFSQSDKQAFAKVYVFR